MNSPTPLAVVTGASSGIGAATARTLAAAGFDVVCVARRTERIEVLATEIGGRAVTCDLTDADQVAALAEAVGPTLDLLVNNAGGAIGLEAVEHGEPDDWRRMYEINVISTLQTTRALLPALEADGGGTVLNVGSTAGRSAYEGGGGYTAAKHAVAVMTETLRLELNGRPVRVCEVDPGMVHTEEFSLTRFRGDADRAGSVYDGVEPLVAEDIAETITWVATRPQRVNVDLVVVKPLDQAAHHKVARRT
ncbi:SDR family oxidoreductase [Aeromicrobium sp. CTD01-1L150]|uniref:SDR family oxidoreductase n=1 Tax=Aeromicrobium sp. CTD01-1L150 TaxID=3341830 RepID=UPI0035BF83AA